MSARDELAQLVLTRTKPGALLGGESGGDRAWFLGLADAILAAGWRKPRTVTTVAELEALPVGSIVMAGDEIYRRVEIPLRPEETFSCLDEAIDVREYETYRADTLLWQGRGGPSATVLFEPEVTE